MAANNKDKNYSNIDYIPGSFSTKAVNNLRCFTSFPIILWVSFGKLFNKLSHTISASDIS
eukprot:Pgem_evm1s5294